MSNRASLLASLTGDDTSPLGLGGDTEEEVVVSDVCIDSSTAPPETFTNQSEGNGTLGNPEPGLFTVDGGDDDDEEEADLFGSIPSKRSTTTARSNSGGPRALLEGSGLIGTATNGGGLLSDSVGDGGGLFDEVDAAAERERLRLEAEERERQRQIALQKEAESQAAREKAEREQAERLAQEQAAAAQAQMREMSLQNAPDVFYRPDANNAYPNPLAPPAPPPPPQPINAGYGASSYYYSTSGQQTTTAQQPYPPSQPPPPAPLQNAPLMQGRYQNYPPSQPSPPPPRAPPSAPPPHPSSQSVVSSVTAPSLLAGMHVGHNPSVGGVHSSPAPPPAAAPPRPPAVPSFQPFYGLVTVSDPILVQGTGLFSGPPHWTYGVTVRMNKDQSMSVRRRFKHFVALEDRLRANCPGAILSPRPEKHASRALEEASARQSAQFAMQRAQELERYLNSLINHPIVGSSDVLRLFLTLQDHIGVAWPEVSSSAITRLSTLGNTTANKISDGAANAMQDLGVAQQQAAGEDNAEILALVASEGVRIAAVSQAVPKMEGTIALLREQADRSGMVGLELSKLTKEVQQSHVELATPLEFLSSALLRSARRSKRLSVELNAAMLPFSTQYKLCRYERLAFADRRQALIKRTAARQKADARATKLHLHQSSLQTRHNIPALERMEMEASMSDGLAREAVQEADKVGAVLLEEIRRVGGTRTEEWRGSVKVLASSMKEACAERVGIWESVREQFMVEFPEMGGGVADAGIASTPLPQEVGGQKTVSGMPATIVDHSQNSVSYSTTGEVVHG
mmetsp:Transcript_7986/g.11953  ORF Transcript_7986/g.11953 Transcript_7986/m.11953 type:complete len:797 (-) Transcript_7986:935-3325(-)